MLEIHSRGLPGRALSTLALLALLVPTAAAAAPPSENAVTSSLGAAGIEWTFTAAQGEVVLTVSGPGGFYQRQAFPAGSNPSFSVFDAAGEVLADGVYKYELRAAPMIDRATRRAMAAARTAGDAAADKLAATLPHGVVEAGSFSIAGGALVAQDEVEPAAAGGGQEGPQIAEKATVLTVNDGVVKNSLCVGFDCPNSPSFSDTTILMMENNTRIKFDDTSSTSSFPNNDWEIEANSNVNGGAEYIGFNDCGTSSQGGCANDLVFAVEAGVRQSALYVEADGDVGVGTSNPVVTLHLVEGNTPTLRLEQDNSSGFTPQTWDVAGNETNFFIRDATGGSQLPFRIQPGADSNSLFIDSANEVGVGTSAPDAPLHVFRSSTVGSDGQLHVENTTGSQADRNMIRVENNGPPTLFFNNTNIANGFWTYTVNNSNEFQINAAAGAFPGQELRLTTAGNLIISGTLTTGSSTVYPDYVFDPGYPLMPLGELKGFIEANGHLPRIPSAEESAGTINLSDMQLKLLEKVEELTLYTLSQEELIQGQQDVISDLRQRLESLEKSLER